MKKRIKTARKSKRSKPNRTSTNPRSYLSAKTSGEKKEVGALFEDLVALQARLRAPNGCPWDREQTHQSLRTYLLEETYEALDALDSDNFQDFAGELGDLLLQILFHADLAKEAGRFDIADVIKNIHDKMVRRHPHVFGDAQANSAAEVLKNWEQLKAEERAAKGGKLAKPSGEKTESILDAVPRSLPALLEAHQLTRRAANVGFDWKDVEGLFDKLAEETGELRKALVAGDRSRQEEEAGDLLFVCVNLARFLGFDAEIALKKTNRKFSRRFREMEQASSRRGQPIAKLSPEELEILWTEAKRKEASAAG